MLTPWRPSTRKRRSSGPTSRSSTMRTTCSRMRARWSKFVLAVERFTKDDREHGAVLGFMTGSEPLDWLLRRRLGHLFEELIRHVRGLRHKTGAADRRCRVVRPARRLGGAWRFALRCDR